MSAQDVQEESAPATTVDKAMVSADTYTPAASTPAPRVQVAAPMPLQARADRMMARALPELRYRLSAFGWPGVAGAVALMGATIVALVLLLPAQQSIHSLAGQLTQATQSVPLPATQALSPHQFAATLPSRGQVPALLGTVLSQATEAGVSLDQGKYTFTPAAGNRLARYSFEFPVKADYASIRAFINKSLTAIPALGLEKLHIERKNVGDTTVNAEVGFVIYLRGA